MWVFDICDQLVFGVVDQDEVQYYGFVVIVEICSDVGFVVLFVDDCDGDCVEFLVWVLDEEIIGFGVWCVLGFVQVWIEELLGGGSILW